MLYGDPCARVVGTLYITVDAHHRRHQFISKRLKGSSLAAYTAEEFARFDLVWFVEPTHASDESRGSSEHDARPPSFYIRQ